MDEHLLLVLDFDNVCRLCLNSNGALSDIFKKTPTSETYSLQDQISRVTGLDVSEGDGLPRTICHKCRYIVETAYELREAAETSNKLLKEVVSVNNTDNKLKHYVHTGEKPVEREEEFNNFEEFEEKNEEMQKQKKVTAKNLTCQICLQAFQTEQKVRLHTLKHYTDSTLTPYLDLVRPYWCEKCGEKGLSRVQLVRHHREHLGVNPYCCKEDGCGFVGKDLKALRHHASVHSARDFICSECGAAFKRSCALAVHEARLHRGAEASCARCGVHCRNEVALRAHLRTHELTRRFHCSHLGCSRSYLSRGHLAAHAAAHGARRHACDQCSAAYTSASLLNRHKKQHGRGRAWQCSCGARFSQYGPYYEHRRQHAARPHRCHCCGYSYKSEEQLKKHLERCEPAVKLRTGAGNETLHNSGQQNASTEGKDSHLDNQEQNDLHDLSSEGLLFIQVGP